MVLSVYHFLLFFQNKDKSYLFYSSYTFLIFLRNIIIPENTFLHEVSFFQPFVDFISYISVNLEWTYNTVYFIFAFSFVNLKSYSLKWYQFVFWGVAVLFVLNICTEFIYQSTKNSELNDTMYYIMSGILTVFALICYIPLFKAKGFLKYYIIVGSSTFLLFSILALLESIFHVISDAPDKKFFIFIFYIGVVLENMLFSLGLGHKQRVILQEKNKADRKLIAQLKENERLREDIQIQLKKDIEIISKTAEQNKIEKLKSKYDKELAELKLSSLRNQMNPHFIFNSLNSIKLYIINNEKENAVYYLNKFSKLIRKILDTTSKKVVLFAKELETSQLYISMENIRFQNEIDFQLTVEKSLQVETLKLPSLILQPFIENAIWHGLSSKKGKKKLTIKAAHDPEGYIHIEIEDNGIGRKKAAEIKRNKLHKKQSIGLQLTEERLLHFSKEFKNQYKIEFVDLYDDQTRQALGTLVILKIPTK